jgi:hypothetical protein
VFPSSWLICLFGLIYFTVGKFIYKYQLLYAMVMARRRARTPIMAS